MLFCNFMRINPQLVVQRLTEHKKYTISEFAMLFCRWGKYSKFWEKIKCQFKQLGNKLLKVATLSEHNVRILGSYKKYFQL